MVLADVLALRSRYDRAALALRYTHAGIRGTVAVGSPRRQRQLPLLISPLLLSLCHHRIHASSCARALALARALSLARDHALATLALHSHSRPRFVCTRARAAASLPRTIA